MIESETVRRLAEKENELLLGKIKQKFPFLLKHYPKITWIDEFIVKHILHINKHVMMTDCSVPYKITEHIKLTYRFPFCKKEYQL